MIAAIGIKSIVSLVFFVSASTKLRDLHAVVLELSQALRLPKSNYTLLFVASFGLVLAELAAAVSYAIVDTRTVTTIVLLLLVCFTIYVLLKRMVDKTYTCSCFGTISILNQYPLTRNMLLISLVWMDLVVTNPIDPVAGAYVLAINCCLAVLLVFGANVRGYQKKGGGR